MIQGPRYVVGANHYVTVEAAARALLDCGGNCPAVDVSLDVGHSRPLTERELRRLGTAVTNQRAGHRRARDYTGSELENLVTALAVLDPALD